MSALILNTTNDFRQWLHRWNLSKYEQLLRDHGIETQDDFRFIQSKQQSDTLVHKLGNIPFVHVLKLEDAWRSIMTRYKDISDDIINIAQQANNDFHGSAKGLNQLSNAKVDQLISALNHIALQQREHQKDSTISQEDDEKQGNTQLSENDLIRNAEPPMAFNIHAYQHNNEDQDVHMDAHEPQHNDNIAHPQKQEYKTDAVQDTAKNVINKIKQKKKSYEYERKEERNETGRYKRKHYEMWAIYERNNER
eukprot:376977_1